MNHYYTCIKCAMENLIIISKNVKAVNAPITTWLIGNNTTFKHFVLVLIYVEVLLILISKLCHSSITHLSVYMLTCWPCLSPTEQQQLPTSTVPEETLQTTSSMWRATYNFSVPLFILSFSEQYHTSGTQTIPYIWNTNNIHSLIYLWHLWMQF